MSDAPSLPEGPPGPVPVLAPTWKRGCGLTIMILGIILTAFSGLCTAGMTIGDMTSGGGGGGDLNLSGVQYVVGGPFILIGALMWWGGARLKRLPQFPDPGGPPSPPVS